MPLHRDATYENLHPPRGASITGGNEPLVMRDSAYAMHWQNQATRSALLLDTSFANLCIFALGNATDPAALILPGASEVQASVSRLYVNASDPAAPASGVKLYSKDVAGTDHLFARTDDGTVHQLTPLSGGAFDPTDIEIGPSAAGALLVHDGTQDWLRFNTNTPMVSIGNTTDNPAVTMLGGGALTLTTGGISIPDNSATAFRVLEGANSYLTVSTEDAGSYMLFGQATTNPEYGFQGAGFFTVGSVGSNRFIVGPTESYFLHPLLLGNGASSATPDDGELHVTAASGTDIAGADLILAGGTGTGTGIGGSVLLQTAPAGTTGTTPGTLTTQYELASTGVLARSAFIAIGALTAIPVHANTVAIGEHTSATAYTNTENIAIGRTTGPNSGARAISISSVGRSGATGADSITIQSAGGGGATGSRSISIGGAQTTAGADAVALGYGTSVAHATCVGLGRGAASTATNQFIVGGNGQPITDFYLGESVTKATAFTATAIILQPTEGTGTNRAGLPLTIRGGRGTGTGNAGATDGSLTLATYPAIGTGTTQHTAAPRLLVRADGTTLMASHADMSDALDRDEARHMQTGSIATVSTATNYDHLTITPELSDGFYQVSVRVVVWEDDSGSPTAATYWGHLFVLMAGGTPTILAWDRTTLADPPVLTSGTGTPAWAAISGSSVLIRQTTSLDGPGRVAATAEWFGTQYT